MFSITLLFSAFLFWVSGLVTGLMLDFKTRAAIKVCLADMAYDLLSFVKRCLYGR